MLENISLIWTIWDFLKSDTGTMLIVALFGVSEALASIPQIQSNSVFQVIYNALKKLAGK